MCNANQKYKCKKCGGEGYAFGTVVYGDTEALNVACEECGHDWNEPLNL